MQLRQILQFKGHFSDKISVKLSSYTYLAFLVSISQDLETVCCDGEEFHVIALQEGHHLLQASSKTDSHLGTILVQEKIVKSCDSVEQHRFYRGAVKI